MTEQDTGFQPLFERLAGKPVDDTLHDGVPAWLSDPLRDWLAHALSGDEALARRVLLRLCWTRRSLDRAYADQLIWCNADQLLTVIDAVLQLHPYWWDSVEWLKLRPDVRRTEATDVLDELDEILTDGRSRYKVDFDRHCLTVRVDTTVTAAADMAAAADRAAGDHLQTAWGAAYGLNPDPDKAYDEAVLAVEALSAPLICPKADGKRTLGKVIADLKSQRDKWESNIGDPATQPANIDRWIGMLELLWTGQSRHAGSTNSRRQTQQEAEAAVHLAATLVQWLATSALRRTP